MVERAVEAVIDAIEVLRRHPLIGWPAEQDLRELVISRGKTGYIALYDFLEERDLARILAIWHQRELGAE
jgi:plasmid stabilization system protein ParE